MFVAQKSELLNGKWLAAKGSESSATIYGSEACRTKFLVSTAMDGNRKGRAEAPAEPARETPLPGFPCMSTHLMTI